LLKGGSLKDLDFASEFLRLVVGLYQGTTSVVPKSRDE